MTTFLTKDQIFEDKEFYLDEMRNGKVFIYPTDTLFWLWTHAGMSDSVKRIFEIKKREQKPLLVMVPWLDWVTENCEVSKKQMEIMKQKLPGPYSFVLNLKNQNAVSDFVVQGNKSIGIRIPDVWFADLIEEAGVVFTSTSVNISWEPSCISMYDVSEDILSQVDYVVNESMYLSGIPSTIIDLRGNESKILRK